MSNRWIKIALTSLALSTAVGCISDKQTAVDELLRAQLERDQGNRQMALARLASAIERNPQLALAYTTRADILKEMGNYKEAADNLEKAAKLEPYNFRTHYQLGLMYQYLKQFGDAIRAYSKAVEIRPLDTEANMNLALVYSQSGDPMRGLNYARAAVNGGPDNALAHANLGSIYSQLGYTDLAIDEFKRAIELAPKQADVYQMLASEYLKQNKWEQGRQVLETAQALANSASISERLGYAYYKLGRLDAAQGAYESSLKNNPSYYQAMNGLGVISMTRALQTSPADVKLAKEAIAYWHRSLQVQPDQPQIKRLVDKYSGTADPVTEKQNQNSSTEVTNLRPGT